MTSLIKSLSLKNFKGFSDEVRIDLRPITLLFGANSAGKSTVLHALQYAREILERNNANADRTLQGGEAVDLGGFLNLVHGRQAALDKDPDLHIEIEIEMLLGDTSIPELVPDAFEDWQNLDDEVWSFYDTLQGVRRKVNSVGIRLIVGWNGLRNEPIVVGYEISTNGAWCVKFESTADGRDVRMRINKDNPIFLVEGTNLDEVLSEMDDWVSPNDLMADLKNLTESVKPDDKLSAMDDRNPEDLVANLKDLEAGIKDQFAQLRDRLAASKDQATNIKGALDEIVATTKVGSTEPVMVSILGGVFDAVRESGMEKPGDGLRSWLNGFSGALPRLDRMLFIPAPGAKGAANVYIAREFTAFLSWLTIGPAMLLREQLRKLRYIGPLRRIPPRGFDVSLTKSEAGWSDGMAGWESLLSGPQRLVDDCSEWMADTDKLATGYTIVRKLVQEFDLSQPVPQPMGRATPRIELVDSASLSHQPQDVGVGISQVLPVVVAAQDQNASVVCIEQPELHVHPSIQVGLGDLFIDGALDRGLSFLIETHSEHLVMRLQRRIRESTSGELAEGQTAVEPKLVTIIFLERSESGVMVAHPIGLDANGKFTAPWPKGFFVERMRETLPKSIRERVTSRQKGNA